MVNNKATGRDKVFSDPYFVVEVPKSIVSFVFSKNSHAPFYCELGAKGQVVFIGGRGWVGG